MILSQGGKIPQHFLLQTVQRGQFLRRKAGIELVLGLADGPVQKLPGLLALVGPEEDLFPVVPGAGLHPHIVLLTQALDQPRHGRHGVAELPVDVGEGDPPVRVVQNIQKDVCLDGGQPFLGHGAVARLLQLDVDLPVFLDQDASIHFHAGSTSFQFVLL